MPFGASTAGQGSQRRKIFQSIQGSAKKELNLRNSGGLTHDTSILSVRQLYSCGIGIPYWTSYNEAVEA
jgi:hypothetical protein